MIQQKLVVSVLQTQKVYFSRFHSRTLMSLAENGFQFEYHLQFIFIFFKPPH